MKIKNVLINPVGIKNLPFKSSFVAPPLKISEKDIFERLSPISIPKETQAETANPTEYAQRVASDAAFMLDEIMLLFKNREKLNPKKHNLEYALQDGTFVMREKTPDGTLERESKFALRDNGTFYLQSVSVPVDIGDDRSNIYEFNPLGVLTRYEEASETFDGNKQCDKIIEFDGENGELKSFTEYYFYSADEKRASYSSRTVFDIDDSGIPF